jgi:hypothetical protein
VRIVQPVLATYPLAKPVVLLPAQFAAVLAPGVFTLLIDGPTSEIDLSHILDCARIEWLVAHEPGRHEAVLGLPGAAGD